MIIPTKTVDFLLVIICIVSFVGCVKAVESPEPDSSVSTTPNPTGPSSNNITSTKPASPTLSPGRELELAILSLTPVVKPGGEVSLRILTAPTATASVAVYYPEGNEPATLQAQKVGPEGEASWAWNVPVDSPPGEARVEVTASVIGRSLQIKEMFLVEVPQ